LDFHNHSIVLSPEDANGYYLKSVTLYHYIFEKNLDTDKMQDIWQQLKANCDLTISKAIAQGRGYDQASKCYEFLAEMHYVYASNGDSGGAHFPVTGDNNALAEEYALKALSIINAPSSDVCPTAQKILNDISARRKKVAELKNANVVLRTNMVSENGELERQNTTLENEISDLKSSINYATTYGSTNFFDMIDFNGELWLDFCSGFGLLIGSVAGVVGLVAIIRGKFDFGIICLSVTAVAFAIRRGIIEKNINIRDTLKAIQEKETKIIQNSHQITNNRYTTNAQVQNNDYVIAQQSAGLAPSSRK